MSVQHAFLKHAAVPAILCFVAIVGLRVADSVKPQSLSSALKVFLATTGVYSVIEVLSVQLRSRWSEVEILRKHIDDSLLGESRYRRRRAARLLTILVGGRFGGGMMLPTKTIAYWQQWWITNRDDLVWDPDIMMYLEAEDVMSDKEH